MGATTVRLGTRCDEILRLIDAALEPANTERGPVAPSPVVVTAGGHGDQAGASLVPHRER